MSDIQVGDQTSKPQDLEKTEMVLNAVIESEVKKAMGSLKGLEKITKYASQSDFPGMGGGAAPPRNDDSGGGAMSMIMGGGPQQRKRGKGSVSLKEWRSTQDSFTQSKRSKPEIMARERMAESAFAGKLNKTCKKYSTASSRDLVEDCNLLKAQWSWLPKGLVADKSLLANFGFGHLKEAHDAIQAEKTKPAMSAIISGTANDMDKFASIFKSGLDEGVKENIYAGASSQFKQKLNPLMSQ